MQPTSRLTRSQNRAIVSSLGTSPENQPEIVVLPSVSARHPPRHHGQHLSSLLTKYFEIDSQPPLARRREIALTEGLTAEQVAGWYRRTRRSLKMSISKKATHGKKWRESTDTSTALTENTTSSEITRTNPGPSVDEDSKILQLPRSSSPVAVYVPSDDMFQPSYSLDSQSQLEIPEPAPLASFPPNSDPPPFKYTGGVFYDENRPPASAYEMISTLEQVDFHTSPKLNLPCFLPGDRSLDFSPKHLNSHFFTDPTLQDESSSSYQHRSAEKLDVDYGHNGDQLQDLLVHWVPSVFDHPERASRGDSSQNE